VGEILCGCKSYQWSQIYFKILTFSVNKTINTFIVTLTGEVNMSKRSDAVKRWRQNTKQRIINSMGGKCQICGYNKCNEAMELHHINPEEKEFSFGKVRGNPQSWIKIADELRKCILLCNRCHSEVHYGIVNLPKNFCKFNEEYNDYLSKQKEQMFDECPVCRNKKNIHQKTCSHKCAAKLSWSIDWNKVNLEEELKNGKSYSKISEELNISMTTVKKRCERLGLSSLNKFKRYKGL